MVNTELIELTSTTKSSELPRLTSIVFGVNRTLPTLSPPILGNASETSGNQNFVTTTPSSSIPSSNIPASTEAPSIIVATTISSTTISKSDDSVSTNQTILNKFEQITTMSSPQSNYSSSEFKESDHDELSKRLYHNVSSDNPTTSSYATTTPSIVDAQGEVLTFSKLTPPSSTFSTIEVFSVDSANSSKTELNPALPTSTMASTSVAPTLTTVEPVQDSLELTSTKPTMEKQAETKNLTEYSTVTPTTVLNVLVEDNQAVNTTSSILLEPVDDNFMKDEFFNITSNERIDAGNLSTTTAPTETILPEVVTEIAITEQPSVVLEDNQPITSVPSVPTESSKDNFSENANNEDTMDAISSILANELAFGNTIVPLVLDPSEPTESTTQVPIVDSLRKTVNVPMLNTSSSSFDRPLNVSSSEIASEPKDDSKVKTLFDLDLVTDAVPVSLNTSTDSGLKLNISLNADNVTDSSGLIEDIATTLLSSDLTTLSPFANDDTIGVTTSIPNALNETLSTASLV